MKKNRRACVANNSERPQRSEERGEKQSTTVAYLASFSVVSAATAGRRTGL